MPRKQVLASPQEVSSLLSTWERDDRAVDRERGHWRTQMSREAKSALRAVKGTSVSIDAALRAAALEKQLEWEQADLETDLARVEHLRRCGVDAEHILAYERRIAARRLRISRLLTEVA